MSTTSSTIQVTIELPKAMYERAIQTAGDRQCPLETLLTGLIDEGLQTYDAENLWSKISESYRDRLSQSGQLNQTTDEVLADLAVIRDQVADEFYPD